MLREIGLRDFVLMETLRLKFDAGLNVLTGETGAGKSILLEALGLLMGERFRSDQLREGSERCEIDGLFDAPGTPEFRAWWDEHGFESSSDILIRREGTSDGRSRAFLNDRPITLGALEELGRFLVDIHGQNEHQQILQPQVQLSFLDRFGGLEEETAALSPLYKTWRESLEAARADQLSENERVERIDLYRFQLKEIEQAQLKEGEDAALAAHLPELKNAEKLRALAQEAYNNLFEQEGSILERMGQLERQVVSLAGMAATAQPLAADLQEVRSRLDESARVLRSLLDRWDFDPTALETAVSRQDLLSRLQKKYGHSVADVLAYAEKIQGDLDRLDNADSYRAALQKLAQDHLALVERACRALSAKRQAAARKLSQSVQKQLKDLGFTQAIFRCEVQAPDVALESDYSVRGWDRVSFEWAPNPGEGVRPLKQIASGGEMSRLMLALKSVLAHADAVPTVVFDEVDAGIGGITAQAVGQKLRALSHHHQILCISHLPQIASCAQAHFQVSKRVSKSRTVATVMRLESDERLEELARLLGSQPTPTSLQHAKELLAQNQ